MGRKNTIAKQRRAARKVERTPKQNAKDCKYWACGRKVVYMKEAEAQEVANRLGHKVYPCSYGEHWHTAHIAGSQRFVRARA